MAEETREFADGPGTSPNGRAPILDFNTLKRESQGDSLAAEPEIVGPQIPLAKPTNDDRSSRLNGHMVQSRQHESRHQDSRFLDITQNSRKATMNSVSEANQDEDNTEKWRNLQNLKDLLNNGFITQAEYNSRSKQIIDGLTGTTYTRSGTYRDTKSSKLSDVSMQSTRTAESIQTLDKHGNDWSVIKSTAPVNRNPPSFDDLPFEKATKIMYDYKTKSWKTQTIRIKLDTTPFARGGLRKVYHLQDYSSTRDDITKTVLNTSKNGPISYVAKMSMSKSDMEDPTIYYRDVEMQTVARNLARQFNTYNPPKKVDFVKAWLIRLDKRVGKPICGVERFINGPYRKHNNNYGYVNENERNTPQAYSHYTYEATKHTLLVCDIQGVGDMYTDPQVHNIEHRGFGKGNMGPKGIQKFVETHTCNPICRYLRLQPLNNGQNRILGTIPQQTKIPNSRVYTVDWRGAEEEQDVKLPLLVEKEKTVCCNPCTLL